MAGQVWDSRGGSPAFWGLHRRSLPHIRTPRVGGRGHLRRLWGGGGGVAVKAESNAPGSVRTKARKPTPRRPDPESCCQPPGVQLRTTLDTADNSGTNPVRTDVVGTQYRLPTVSPLGFSSRPFVTDHSCWQSADGGWRSQTALGG